MNAQRVRQNKTTNVGSPQYTLYAEYVIQRPVSIVTRRPLGRGENIFYLRWFYFCWRIGTKTAISDR